MHNSLSFLCLFCYTFSTVIGHLFCPESQLTTKWRKRLIRNTVPFVVVFHQHVSVIALRASGVLDQIKHFKFSFTSIRARNLSKKKARIQDRGKTFFGSWSEMPNVLFLSIHTLVCIPLLCYFYCATSLPRKGSSCIRVQGNERNGRKRRCWSKQLE